MTDRLDRYKAKRNFSITTEPAEGGAAGTELSFVIQKHWASRLHYDFRLELNGTMLSWAVPKGPSYDSKDKRMAVHVEDHPISYSSFEGTIPDKQYGAGKVIIWDNGTWHPIGDPDAGYKAGNLKFELRGHKMVGRWALIRIKGRGSEKQEPWLLIKEKDEYVKPGAEFSVVDEFPDSVKGLAPVGGAKDADAAKSAEPGKPERSVKPEKAEKSEKSAKPVTTKAVTSRKSRAVESPHPEATKSALPATFSPQLATLVDAPPKDPDNWIYEIKFDGYRLLARVDGTDIKLFTRNGNDWTSRMTNLHAAIKKAKLPTGWYDGEIVVVNEHGVPDFGALQGSFDSTETNDIVFYMFDAPYLGGYDMRAVPLDARRELLRSTLETRESDALRFSAVFDAPPQSVVQSACQLGLEGIIAKRKDSTYKSSRSIDWIKLKCSRRQEFLICGWTDPQGARSGFGSLLLGVHDADGNVVYAGNVGTGFNDKTLAELKAKLDKIATDKMPFAVKARVVGRPHWVEPVLIAEVTFAEWTKDGSIRHSVFHGLRTDKEPKAIIREEAASAPKPKAKPQAKSEPKGSLKSGAAENPAKAQKGLAHKEPVSHALSDRFRVTNPDRVIDKKTGATKIELVRYYGLVGDLMMEHLKGRPVSLVRAPAGVEGQLFFQKHAEVEKLPGIIQLDPALYISHPPMLEVASKQGLLSAAQWNVIEVHTLNTVSASFENPDRIVFDLDPGEGVEWAQIQKAAEVMHVFLGQLGLPAFLKTSGGKGLHVVVPIKKTHDWDEVKSFSQAVVVHLSKTLPQMFVAKSGPKNRVGKIFIDYLRNGLGATTVCAWSARARPGLGISVPVEWEELDSLRGGDHWTIRDAHARLDKGNDPWNGYAKAAKSLKAATKALG